MVVLASTNEQQSSSEMPTTTVSGVEEHADNNCLAETSQVC